MTKQIDTVKTDNRPQPFASKKMIQRARQLRREMSTVEDRVWGFLRNGHVEGLKFRRQHPIGPYVVDFYCHAHQLAIEIDGPSHDDHAEYDIKRALWLNQHGYRVIRFTNENVLKDPDGVREAIRDACGVSALTRRFAPTSPRGGGERALASTHTAKQSPFYPNSEIHLNHSSESCSPPPQGEVVHAKRDG